MVGLLALATACGACGHGGERPVEPPSARCGLLVWHRPEKAGTRVEVRAAWEGWSIAHPMSAVRAAEAGADGWLAVELAAPEGEQQYAIVELIEGGEDGAWKADATIGTTAWANVAGVWREVASVRHLGCSAPVLSVEQITASPTGAVRVSARFLSASSAQPLDPKAVSVRFLRGEPVVGVTESDPATGAITFEANLPPGKHRLLLSASDRAGIPARNESALATVWVEPKPWDWRDAVIYQVMVDRYRGAAGAPLENPSPVSARAGGKVAGVTAAIESGELAALGVNTVWLSPLYQNAVGMWPGSGAHTYSSYHGYWPTAARKLETTLAPDEQALDALIKSAHAHGMRVVFDVVPNHVHQDHPYAAQHPEWFNGNRNADGSWRDPCVCGYASCPWGEHSLDCWFAPYMPDVDFRNLDAARTFADDVAWWIDRFDGDGVRIDAVPLMPRAAVRRIAGDLRRRFDHPTADANGRPAEAARTLVLGEIFTGSEGYDALRYFLGPFGLDSAFEFPLMWSLRAALAERRAPMSSIDETFRAGEAAFRGSGGVMSLILGNHDVPRFASVANGDGARDGWNPAPQPTDAGLLARMGVGFGILFALPGMPTVYYGDEVGLAGGGDPDSRRVMPREDELAPAQRALRDRVRAMGKARGCLSALRRGTYRLLASDPERLVFAREAPGADPVVVVATRDDRTRLEAPLPGVAAGTWVDVLSGESRALDPARTAFEEPAGSVRWYVPTNSACRP